MRLASHGRRRKPDQQRTLRRRGGGGRSGLTPCGGQPGRRPPFLGSPAFNLPPFVTPLLSPPVLGGGEGSGQEKQISGGGRLGRGCGGGRPLGAGLGGPISRRMCEIGEVRAAQAWRWCPIKLEYVPAPCKQAWRRQLRERRGPFGGGGGGCSQGSPKSGTGGAAEGGSWGRAGHWLKEKPFFFHPRGFSPFLRGLCRPDGNPRTQASAQKEGSETG